jgi:hypothetical protein
MNKSVRSWERETVTVGTNIVNNLMIISKLVGDDQRGQGFKGSGEIHGNYKVEQLVGRISIKMIENTIGLSRLERIE